MNETLPPALSDSERLHTIALTKVPRIGSKTARKLVAACGSAEAVFQEKKTQLRRIHGIGASIIHALDPVQALREAESEWQFAERYDIAIHCWSDTTYPRRMRSCEDAPLVLYTKGELDFNTTCVVAVVGTRNATSYGKQLATSLVEGLQELRPLVISGLARGIDIESHKAALKYGVPTAGVLAHGLDRLYPAEHRGYAERMLESGGLITDFPKGTNPDRENFPKRNRIIAGLCDALVVVESKRKGGSMITAEIAHSYNRDVFAFPGRTTDANSEGCHFLIQSHKAALIDSARELCYQMGWELDPVKKQQKAESQIALSSEEEILVRAIREKGPVSTDELTAEFAHLGNPLSWYLLQLEMNGLIRSLPGNRYELR